MPNTKGNAVPLWGITSDFTVVAFDLDHKPKPMSDSNFALKIAIAEDGTVWAVTTTPDPDGGGAKIFWSDGNGNWTEINTPDPGGVAIAGYSGSSCIYLDDKGILRTLTTDGETEVIFNNPALADFDYCAGYLWALFPQTVGGPPVLQYKNLAKDPDFHVFVGDKMPVSLSVDYQGDCSGALDGTPQSFANDGQSEYPIGSGLEGKTLQITSKNWSYALSSDINEDGNMIYMWQDVAGGQFQSTGMRASYIATTFYMGNR
ncbi:MAG: hypothetical protein AAFR97_00915 [Bacteroidota bacterium]